jgi:DNA-binding CsgD family transcriptional regulator
MENLLRLILVSLSLLAGAIAIYFSHRLMQKHRVDFVGSYFYYLVFLYIFGTYSLIGSGVFEHLFTRMEAAEETLHSTRLFSILPGIPLLGLSMYMFIRSIAELLSRKLWTVFLVGYFVLTLVFFVLYGILSVRLTWFGLGDYAGMVRIQQWVFSGFMLLVYLISFGLAFTAPRKLPQHVRSFARVYSSWYLLFMLLTNAGLLLSGLHEILPYLFIFLLLSWHLIPLLFMNMYLEKFHGPTAEIREDFDALLAAFSEKYEISKREREVILLICKGLSNQEISDTLFISLQTVKDHVHRIFLKSDVKNRVQLTNLIRSGR